MGQGSLALWEDLCHHSRQVRTLRAHQLSPACEEAGHWGFTGSLPHCYSPGARTGITAEMSCLRGKGCARASTLDVYTTNVQLEAGYSMLPSQWAPLAALVASQALQLSRSPRQPCWLHCRTRLLPLAQAGFLLFLLGFCECLPSPVPWAYWTHICYCLCAYARLRLQVVLSFPTLSFFIVDKSEPCIYMPVDTLQGSAGATKSHPGRGPGSPLLPGHLLLPQDSSPASCRLQTSSYSVLQPSGHGHP